MVIASAVGLSLLAITGSQLFVDHDKRKFFMQLQKNFIDAGILHKSKDGQEYKAEIKKLIREEYGFQAEVWIPNGMPLSKFKQSMEAVEMATNSTISVQHLHGRKCILKFGKLPLHEGLTYNDKLMQISKGVLGIPVFSSFGLAWINFWNNNSYHLLVGGATRMGKSKFIELLMIHLLRQTDGEVKIFYLNFKEEDTFIYENIPQIIMGQALDENPDAPYEVLEMAEKEISDRRKKLRTTRDSKNVLMYREKHPEDPIPPMFIVVDEFAQFTDEEYKEFQKRMTSIAETSGYLDVHLVIASQRPDAKDVIKPRMKANMLTRLSFTTAKEADSMIILDIPDAAHLGGIKGRAILLDGLPIKVQIPYVSDRQVDFLLSQFRRKNNDTKRQEDTETADTLPSFVEGTLGEDDLPGGSGSESDNQSDYETPDVGRFGDSHPATQRPSISIHAKSYDDAETISEDTTFPGACGRVYSIKDAEHLRDRAQSKRKLSTRRVHKDPKSDDD